MQKILKIIQNEKFYPVIELLLILTQKWGEGGVLKQLHYIKARKVSHAFHAHFKFFTNFSLF